MSTTTDVKRVIVLGTGGTIAGSGAEPGQNLGYTAGTVGVTELLKGIAGPAGIALEAEQVAQLDSKDMDLATWLKLRTRCVHWLGQSDVAGIVITHGTDTIEETAFFLSSVLDTDKPVVLTCAMRPSTSLSPDGPQNSRDALSVAADPSATGVVVVCAGEIHGARYVSKTHPYRLNAFSSGDVGPIGYVKPPCRPSEGAVVRRRGHVAVHSTAAGRQLRLAARAQRLRRIDARAVQLVGGRIAVAQACAVATTRHHRHLRREAMLRNTGIYAVARARHKA